MRKVADFSIVPLLNELQSKISGLQGVIVTYSPGFLRLTSLSSAGRSAKRHSLHVVPIEVVHLHFTTTIRSVLFAIKIVCEFRVHSTVNEKIRFRIRLLEQGEGEFKVSYFIIHNCNFNDATFNFFIPDSCPLVNI